jgi:glutathione peroxidase-family protein
MSTLHENEVKTIDGKTKKLSAYAGKTLLVVNVEIGEIAAFAAGATGER